MKTSLAHQQKVGTVSVRDLLSKPVYLKPTIIMLALMFFQQLGGINAVMFYMTAIFEAADTGIEAGVQATIVSIVQVRSYLSSCI
jgi:hypothetical protein